MTASCRYEPDINRSYHDLAAHYGTAVVPTRVRKPRDKAKVEVAVQLVQRWVLARLRHRRFFSLMELNAAIRELVDARNDRRCAIWRPAVGRCSRRANATPCCRCLPSPTSMPSGAAAAQASTTTSSCTGIGIPCPRAWSARSLRRASPSGPWSCSTAACASPAICAARNAAPHHDP